MKTNKPNANNTSDLIIRLCIDKIRSILTEFPNEHCRQMLNEVEKRYNDPELKLAIIGEFNTGKSTFINAMLKRDFLSTDNVPTTVIPTYIRWDGKNNAKPSIRISLMNDSKEYTISENWAFLKKKLGISLHENNALERITTNNNLIGVVPHVTVSFPKDKRFKNFCLIDTPGANPGAEETKEHANITREILRKEADATVILFPALVAGNRSALEFISENASHLLDGAAFVITKTDMLDSEKEVSKISDYLKGLVRKKYDLEDQTIYTCSAKRALQAYSKNEATDNYLIRFEAMLTDIFKNLTRKRKQIIFNKLSSLIKIIIEDLRKEQRALTEKLEEDMKILERYSLDNLSAEYNHLFDDFKTRLNIAYSEKKYTVIRKVSQKRAFAYNSIENDIDIIDDLEELWEYANEGIKTELKHYENSIKSGIKEDIDELRDIYEDFSKTLFAKLEEYQLKISPIPIIAKGKTSVNTDISTNVSMVGLLVGLEIVSALPLGWLFKNSLLKVTKIALKNKVMEGLLQFDDTIVNKWQNALVTAPYISYSDQQMADYKEKYKKIFDERIASDSQEKERIKKELSKLQNISKDINIIEDAVNKCSEISLYNENEIRLIVKSLQNEHTEAEQAFNAKNQYVNSGNRPMSKVSVVFSRRDIMMKMTENSAITFFLDIDGNRISLVSGLINRFSTVEKSFSVTANSAHRFCVGTKGKLPDTEIKFLDGTFKISENEQFVIDLIDLRTYTSPYDSEHKTE